MWKEFTKSLNAEQKKLLSEHKNYYQKKLRDKTRKRKYTPRRKY
jgi:hypothetical protein